VPDWNAKEGPMRTYSDKAWEIASKYSHALASETRDLAAWIDKAIEDERESCANIAKNAHLIPMIGTMIDAHSGELIANIIRERGSQR